MTFVRRRSPVETHRVDRRVLHDVLRHRCRRRPLPSGRSATETRWTETTVAHPGRDGNSVWDGRPCGCSARAIEIVAFQVIVEADGNGIRALSAALPELRTAERSAISYRAPAHRSERLGRPADRAVLRQLHARRDARRVPSWVCEPGSPAAPRDPTGWKPVQLVPENARAGRGGFPESV